MAPASIGFTEAAVIKIISVFTSAAVIPVRYAGQRSNGSGLGSAVHILPSLPS